MRKQRIITFSFDYSGTETQRKLLVKWSRKILNSLTGTVNRTIIHRFKFKNMRLVNSSSKVCCLAVEMHTSIIVCFTLTAQFIFIWTFREYICKTKHVRKMLKHTMSLVICQGAPRTTLNRLWYDSFFTDEYNCDVVWIPTIFTNF